ncbi:MAG: nuclear transport factor 2 family protein, partial [Nitrospinae bacterium]|nr:nuclear transport factor 2 family protein [Nitrospinota bacterium]
SQEEADQVADHLRNEEGLSALVIMSMHSRPSSAHSDSPPRIEAAENKTGKAPGPDSSSVPAARSGSGGSVDVVLSQFLLWLNAWEKKNAEVYLGFYASNFKGSGSSHQEWEESRRTVLNQKGTIKIEISEIRMREEEDNIEMSFVQNIRSEGFSDIGYMTLIWKMEGNEWKIVSETRKPA